MLGPVVMGFGYDSDDVLDLFFEGKCWTDGQEEDGAFAAYTNVLDDNCSEEPECHFFRGADEAEPARFVAFQGLQAGDELQASFDLGQVALVACEVGLDLLGHNGLQQGATMRRASGQGEVTKIGPDLIPGDMPIFVVDQGGCTHWGCTDCSSILVAGRKEIGTGSRRRGGVAGS